MLHAVILAGGGGTRLWPLSRANYPKQFLTLLGEHSLLQHTVLRLGETIPAERLWIVTGREQEFVVRAQLAALPHCDKDTVHLLLEPGSRNTAAAIGLAALHVRQRDPQAVMAVLPADHWIAHQHTFVTLLQHAAMLAEYGVLVTLGVVPDRPETGYGYIRRGTPLSSPPLLPEGIVAYQVAEFVEKPDLHTAQRYLSDEAYYWNAGIFIWRASAILEEIAIHMPHLSQGLDTIGQNLGGARYEEALTTVYTQIEPVSIDSGVLEQSPRLVMLPADMGWSDLGEWSAVYRLSSRDARGNALSPHVIDVGSNNSFVYSSGRTIATIGLQNTMVVDTDDALLVCASDRTQEVGSVVRALRARGVEAADMHRTVHRPWGTYTVLAVGKHFKVKRVVVHPGAALSLQLHHSRSEHWVVIAGIAQVTQEDREFLLQANQSTYIPRETRHRLANPGTEPLEIIEVQTGAYLEEDDIVRFADLYRRE